MNKTIKRKLIGSIFCIAISVILFIYKIINYQVIAMNEEFSSYINGLSLGMFVAGIIIFFKVSKALKNPNKAKEMENSLNDERLISINHKSMSIAFRITMFAGAIFSIVCAFTNKMELATYCGLVICFAVMLYVISYYIIIKKN